MIVKIVATAHLLFLGILLADAQVGIATTLPNSSLHIRGSLANNYRPFTLNTVATATDNLMVFTGTVAASVTLPSAVGLKGRTYLIKNAGTGIPAPVVTVIPASTETIDGLLYWTLDEAGNAVLIASNGSSWQVNSLNLQALAAGINWNQNGNNILALKSIGTSNNADLPFITNNTEKMRLSVNGSTGIGAFLFDSVNPEKLLTETGTTASFNAISGKGSINSYLQLNIQNRFGGNLSSSDVVATADNGTDSINFIDMGINSSAFSNPVMPIVDGGNNAYLFTTGNDFILGNATANKSLSFFTGGYTAANEIIRVTGTGLTGIGNVLPTEKLQVEGNMRLSGLNRAIFFDAQTDPYGGIKNISRPGEVNELMLFSGNDVAGAFGADRIRLASHELYFATAPASAATNSGDPASFYQSTVNAPTRMFINQKGNAAIGSTVFSSTNPEELLVDAGNTTSYNVIAARGSYNNYLQFNIQNSSSGASSSSDIVATANNGNETVNYVDLGINSDGYTGSGVISGINNAYLYSTGNNFIIGNNTDNKSLIFYTSTGGLNTQRMRITSAGLLPGQDNTFALGSNANRSTAIWAANGTVQTSDARLKKNIHTLSYGLAAVLKLHPVAYNWINEADPLNKIGLIAQEVKKIIPEVVTGDEDTEKLGLNYAELIPVLINAIKELKQKEIELKKKAVALHLLQ